MPRLLARWYWPAPPNEPRIIAYADDHGTALTQARVIVTAYAVGWARRQG